MYDNEFTCPDNHVFKANAKLRARCPQCGKMSRRFGKGKVDKPSEPVLADAKTEHSDNGAVPDKVPVSSEPPNPVADSVEPRKVRIIKQGRPMAAKKLPPRVNGRFVKATAKVSKIVKKPSTGIVRHQKVSGKVAPKVKRMPGRTAIARHIGEALPKSYTDMMIENSRW